MAKGHFDQPGPTGLFFTRKNVDGTVAWGKQLGGPFDVSGLLQTMMLEATAIGCQVVVDVTLVPTDVLFPPEDEIPLEGEGSDTDDGSTSAEG